MRAILVAMGNGRLSRIAPARRLWTACLVLLGAVSAFGVAARADPPPTPPLDGVLPVAPDGVPRIERAAALYRVAAAAGGWPIVGSGRNLRAGDEDGRVGALRRRLAATGDLDSAAAASGGGMDTALVGAVRRFQARHGLAADGVVGPRTRAALNVPAAERAAALEANAARVAALARRVAPRALVVNIPAAEIALFSGGRVALRSRAIVGRPTWPTPVLDSLITRVEINPYWTVPARIARRELLPRIAAEPGYLRANEMRVLSGPPGAPTEVPPERVDWRRFAAQGYRLRQDPGPGNPLGVVKFSFANPYDVYLHDTPGKAAFHRDRRALSHGCVRVEEAFDLAARLLSGTGEWDATRLRGAIDAGRHRVVPLAAPTPVHIVYVTAWVDPLGTVQFRDDLYGRDRRTAIASSSQPCGPPA
jgi:murein L,D-transpeptidase YcbB/YkuD